MYIVKGYNMNTVYSINYILCVYTINALYSHLVLLLVCQLVRRLEPLECAFSGLNAHLGDR
jgi:hypothetical protein